MTDLEYIDKYFANKLEPSEKLVFEQRLLVEASFADEVAFYAATKALKREKTLAERHTQWSKRPVGQNINFKTIVTGIAAMLLIIAGWLFYIQNSKLDLQTVAQNYINTELATLPVKMDVKEDSLELGKQMYNDGKYLEAEAIFDKLADPKAIEYSGLSALKAKRYPEAKIAFEKLARQTDLIENKGKFYLALTLIQTDENEKAKTLLEEIKKEGLFGADLLNVEK